MTTNFQFILFKHFLVYLNIRKKNTFRNYTYDYRCIDILYINHAMDILKYYCTIIYVLHL